MIRSCENFPAVRGPSMPKKLVTGTAAAPLLAGARVASAILLAATLREPAMVIPGVAPQGLAQLQAVANGHGIPRCPRT